MPHKPKRHRPPTPKTPETRGSAHERGYTRRWREARAAYLAAHPLCVECEREGKLTEATVVDHVIPHRGDYDRFWDSEGNWAALCKPHHDAKTGRGE